MHVVDFNMTNEIVLILSNSLTAIVSWFVGRRKMSADTDNQVLRNLELSVSLYKEIIDSLKVEIQELNLKIQSLEAKINELHEENKILRGHGKGL